MANLNSDNLYNSSSTDQLSTVDENQSASETILSDVKLLTLSQAAKALNVGRDILKLLLDQGKIGTLVV